MSKFICLIGLNFCLIESHRCSAKTKQTVTVYVCLTDVFCVVSEKEITNNPCRCGLKLIIIIIKKELSGLYRLSNFETDSFFFLSLLGNIV